MRYMLRGIGRLAKQGVPLDRNTVASCPGAGDELVNMAGKTALLTALSGSFKYTLFIFLDPTLTLDQFPLRLSSLICSKMLTSRQLNHKSAVASTDNSVFSLLSILLYVSTCISDMRSAAVSWWSRFVTGSGFGVSLSLSVEVDAAGLGVDAARNVNGVLLLRLNSHDLLDASAGAFSASASW
jgi:hypothetical protein